MQRQIKTTADKALSRVSGSGGSSSSSNRTLLWGVDSGVSGGLISDWIGGEGASASCALPPPVGGGLKAEGVGASLGAAVGFPSMDAPLRLKTKTVTWLDPLSSNAASVKQSLPMSITAGVLPSAPDRKLQGSFFLFSEVLAVWEVLLDSRLPPSTFSVVLAEAAWFSLPTSTSAQHKQRRVSWTTLFLGDLLDVGDSLRTFLVYGRSSFCCRVLDALKGNGWLPSDSVLVVGGSRDCRLLTPGLPMTWRSVSHSLVGGVTGGKYRVGCSTNLLQRGDIPLDFSSGITRKLSALLKVSGGRRLRRSFLRRVSKGMERSLITIPSCIYTPSFCLSGLPLGLFEVQRAGYIGISLMKRSVLPLIFLLVASRLSVSLLILIQNWLRPFYLFPRSRWSNLLACEVLTGRLVQSYGNKLDGDVSVDQPFASGKVSLSTFSPSVSKSELAAKDAKAVKSDDAATDEDFWNWKAVTPPLDAGIREDAMKWSIGGCGCFKRDLHDKPFALLRNAMATKFRISVTSSFLRYLKVTYPAPRFNPSAPKELQKDLIAGRDAITRACDSSFWEWSNGSFPFFWRWQPEVKLDMRDSTKLFRLGPMPWFVVKPQRMPKDKAIADRIMEKVNKVRSRGYIRPGTVFSLTSYFHVPKGDSDIRIIYDLTACGLNEVLWAPNFWMPTITNALDCACHSSWFGDVDAGEMFFNYLLLDEDVRLYAGVDVLWSDTEGSQSKNHR